jgi:hypothetical protein
MNSFPQGAPLNLKKFMHLNKRIQFTIFLGLKFKIMAKNQNTNRNYFLDFRIFQNIWLFNWTKITFIIKHISKISNNR